MEREARSETGGRRSAGLAFMRCWANWTWMRVELSGQRPTGLRSRQLLLLLLLLLLRSLEHDGRHSTRQGGVDCLV